MKRILGLLVGVGAVVGSSPAFAIPYQSATVYKATESGATVVVFSSSPGSRIQVNLGSSPKATAKIAGSCGEVKISVPSSGSFAGLKVDGTAVDAASLPTQTLPSCVSGSFAEPRTSNFKTPSGQVVIVGKAPNAAVAIELPQPSTRSVSINACGFGVLKAATGQSLPESFNVQSTSYTTASLPDAQKTPYCRTTNGVSAAYVPSTWMSP